MSLVDQNPVERRVQIAGGRTFTISLPREWGVRHDLSKGETLYLYQDDDRLIVAPSTVDSVRNETRIKITDVTAEGVVQRVKAAYTAGCERVTVVGDGPLEADLIRSVTGAVENLIGMEIRRVTDEEIVIKDQLDPQAVSLSQSLVQMRHIAVEMLRDAATAVRTNDETLARLVRKRDTYIDRLFAFVSRGLHRGLEDINELGRLDVTRKTGFHYYKIARELERIADRAERIADAAQAQSGPPADTVGHEFEELVTAATEVVTSALDDNTDAAIDRYRTVLEGLDALDAELSTSSDPDAYRYGTDVVESVRRTAARGLNIVNMTVEVSVIDMLDPIEIDTAPGPQH
jgi:phosphate uptake regulator